MTLVGSVVLDRAGRDGRAATTVGQEALVDARGDCNLCAGRQDITSLRARVGGDANVLEVKVDGRARAGDVVTVWRAARPAHPVRLVRSGDGIWGMEVPRGSDIAPGDIRVRELAGSVTVEFPNQSPGPIAVTTGGGDRAPDVGHAQLRGSRVRVVELPGGEAARRSFQRIAQAQSGMERLDAGQRMLAVQLIARQQVTGTFTFSGNNPNGASGRMRLTLTIDGAGQQSRQDVHRKEAGRWQLVESRITTVDGERLCLARVPGKLKCTIGRRDEQPATQVLAMQHGAARVVLESRRARTIAGERATCIGVVATVPDAPNIGERCAFVDGTLAFIRLANVQQELVLAQRSDAIDAGAFVGVTD